MCMRAIVTIILAITCLLSGSAESITIKMGGNAEAFYESGFMHMLMKHPSGGVSLFNMELLENDSTGLGVTSDGTLYRDVIWGKNRARK